MRTRLTATGESCAVTNFITLTTIKQKLFFFCCPLVTLGSNIVMAAVNSKDERVLR